MKISNLLIIFIIFISFTFSNEIIDEDYIFNPNINSESLPSKPIKNETLVGSISDESGPIILEYGGAWLLGTASGLALAFSFAFDTFAYGVIPTFKETGGLAGIGYLIGTSLGSATGCYIIGSLFHKKGRFLPSLIGSSLGTLSCFGLFLALGTNEVNDFSVAMLLLTPPAGAVIGYNLSRIKRKTKLSFFDRHFDQPYFSFRTERLRENEIVPVFDFRLVNAKF